MRRLFVVIAVGLTCLPAQAGVTQFDTVITGDSILQLGEADLQRPWRYVDVESGRQPYAVGLEGRMSSDTAVRRLIPLVRAGGSFVFQDNGATTSRTDWRRLLQTVVSLLPDDRCLVGVLPVYLHPDPAVEYEVAVRANIMVQEFSKQPCHDWVRWNQKVMALPYLVYDGQHPTQEGSIWLASEIDRATG